MYKKKVTEFEVQALVYQLLQTALSPLHYVVRGEYKFSVSLSTGARAGAKRGCRPDLAVFQIRVGLDPRLLCVLEVKKSAVGRSTKQGERYSDLLEVPCLYIRGLAQAKQVVALIQKYL